MAAAESGDTWLRRTREREERMRYEVLDLVHQASGGRTDAVLRIADFAQRLGVWREEFFRVVEFLDRQGYLVYHGAGPMVSITRKGVDYLRGGASQRRSIRE